MDLLLEIDRKASEGISGLADNLDAEGDRLLFLVACGDAAIFIPVNWSRDQPIPRSTRAAREEGAARMVEWHSQSPAIS